MRTKELIDLLEIKINLNNLDKKSLLKLLVMIKSKASEQNRRIVDYYNLCNSQEKYIDSLKKTIEEKNIEIEKLKHF